MSAFSQLPRSTPEAEGISSTAILQLIEALARLDSLNSLMIMRHGKVVAEAWWKPYRPEVRHQLFSLSKSFTSVGIGWARAEGRLDLDDPVASFFPEKCPQAVPPRMSRMTVRHLLTMSTGHEACPMTMMAQAADGDFVKAFLHSSLAYEPGTHFVYNSGASYLLSAIVSRVTGEALVDYLSPRLLNPLGILNPLWEACPQGISLGGWGFWLTTEEIARFAQLLLNGGVWHGQQLIPADYLDMASHWQMDNSGNESIDWKQGYGFQFWRCQHNAFRGDGAFGQYALVMPDQDMAIAVTSGLRNMQNILTMIWEILLPAVEHEPLTPNDDAVLALRRRCAELEIPPATGGAVRLEPDMAFQLAENSVGLRQIHLHFEPENCVVTWSWATGEEIWRAGWSVNCENSSKLIYPRSHRAAISAAWMAPDRLELVACFYETPFRVRFIFTFDRGRMTLESISNLNFLRTDWETITGTRS